MNFITTKINYDETSGIYWTQLYYSVEGQEAIAMVGTTKTHLYEIFKKPVGTEFNTAFMNTWLKLAMKDLAKEIPRVRTGITHRKMYATTPEEIESGMKFLLEAETE